MPTGFCSTCGKKVSSEGLHCPRDGTWLTEDPNDKGTSPLVGSLLAGRYRVLRRLGEGGMGEVFLTHHESIEKPVALKVLKPEFSERADVVARFQQEAKSASRVKHPNVVDVFDFGKLLDGRFYLALEYLDGHDLGVEMNKARLSPGRAIEIVLQVCSALAAAHAAAVVHRDMKPENVFLCTERGVQTIKIVDFGIAKLRAIGSGLEGGPEEKRLTRAGAIFGTPEYMAPEQVEGPDVDARADIYAVGIMLYELLTGRVPFQGSSPVHTLTLHMHDAPPRFRDVDPHTDVSATLEAVVMQAIEKAPEARFSSMDELANALRSTPEAMELGLGASGENHRAMRVPPARPKMISSALPIPLVAQRRSADELESVPPPEGDDPPELDEADEIASIAPPPQSAPLVLETIPPRSQGRGRAVAIGLGVVALVVLGVLGMRTLGAPHAPSPSPSPTEPR